jgi:regulatory protein
VDGTNIDAAAVERAREAALRSLERSRKTRRELERRLATKGFDAPTVAAALDRLARVGLIDDVEYARAFVRSKLARRAVALRVIEGQLAARGVSPADRAAALAALDAEAARESGDPEVALRRSGGEGERARADQALAPILRRCRGLDPREARGKAQAALLRRGFDYATVREAVTAALEGPSPEDAEAL